MKRALRFLKVATVELIGFAVLYLAVVEHVPGARNVLLFFFWASALISPFWMHKSIRAKLRDSDDKIMPQRMVWSIVGLTLAVLVWGGEWWFVVPYCIGWFFRAFARGLAQDDRTKEADAASAKAAAI